MSKITPLWFGEMIALNPWLLNIIFAELMSIFPEDSSTSQKIGILPEAFIALTRQKQDEIEGIKIFSLVNPKALIDRKTLDS